MNRIILNISILGLILSCTKHPPKDYATLSGKIDNAKAKEIIISARSGYKKTIELNEDGTFSDTLHIKDKGEMYMFYVDGISRLFIKNDDEIKVNFDAEKPKETIKFTGKGSETSAYIAEKILNQSKININELFALDEKQFKVKSAEKITEFQELLNSYKNLDSAFLAQEKKGLASLPKMLNDQYDKLNKQKNQKDVLKGKPSPDFKNYENFKGGKTSLKDLRGKYVYVDVWATWCGPCKAEIPHLKTLEKDFHGKNITFLSISVDKEADKSKWKKMITDKKMGGVQLFADKSWKSDFVTGYKIKGIPRFILIDPKGNVVDANAPRPSSPKIKKMLKELLK